MKTSTLLLAALATATFSSKDVENATLDLISTLDSELESAGFEAGSDLEEAETTLENTLNEADEEREELDEAAADALASGGEESEDGGDTDE